MVNVHMRLDREYIKWKPWRYSAKFFM